MLSCIRFEALLNTDGDPDCPWPTQETRRGGGLAAGAMVIPLSPIGQEVHGTSSHGTCVRVF